MTKDWSVEQVISACQRMYMGAIDPYMTGWVNWPCKQDLYRVKFAVDEMLEKAGTFAGEDEWLEEQEKQRVWKTLSEKTNR
jgi:hypothetical protein